MKGILLFPVVIFALALDVSGSKEGKKVMDQVLQLAELSKKTKAEDLSEPQQDTERKCEWDPQTFYRKYSCKVVQAFWESKPDLKNEFRKNCPSGDLDLCARVKRPSGEIVRGCVCSSQVSPEYHSVCTDAGENGIVCLCSDEDYCNDGDDFDLPPQTSPPPPPSPPPTDGRTTDDDDARGRSGSDGDLHSALAATTLVVLGLFGPRFF